jgi:secreted trypsin-like serine protease
MAFVVHADANGNPDFVCTGTVISSNVVLTAGHCTADETTGIVRSPGGYAVVTGSVDWSSSSRQLSAVKQVIVSPSYDVSTGAGDAGLLVLTTPTTAPALPLATGADQYLLQPGTPTVITGWGETFPGSGPQEQLQSASTTPQSTSFCSQQGARFDPTLELCAEAYPGFATGTCFGDSGGPLLATGPNGQPVEIGIGVRVGDLNCSTGLPDIFTRVDQMSSWAASWVAVVAPKAPIVPPPTPPPAVTTATLPTMTSSSAHTYTRAALAEAFGRTFVRGLHYTARCSRISRTRFDCAVTWSNQPNDYSGQVTVYYLASQGALHWHDRYALRSVNDHCYFHTKHPQRCKVHTRRGG